MFPTGSEFLILYSAYFAILVFLIYGLLSSKNKAFYKWNMLLYIVYLIIMINVFSDSENFRYGNSLGVLFYGGLLVVSHAALIVLIKLYQLFTKKS
ncbi:hypothetical protein ULMA_05470 [Patiriisocius marinus]|uniref:Uncharacterized protein n=1 Tax=Patiriisocius marinus TaxID=1397112 RepID=A0A5J4IMG7_9FLAO|nr:hypothetical protein ULMA_05470 [Patiriisocius marinus]